MSWGDWREVPGGGLTNLSLTAVVDAGGFDLALFCVGLEGYININSYNFTSKSWSGWSKITGTGRTMVAVSATSVAGILHLYAVSTEPLPAADYERIFLNIGGVWTSPSGSFQTQVAVSATGENVLATGLTNDLYLNPSPSSSPVPGGCQTDAAPAAVTYISGTAETLFVFVKGVSPNQKIYYNVRT